MSSALKFPPSSNWTSYSVWDYNGMKERLEDAMAGLDRPALVRHAESLIKKKLAMSDPFSAGQYWICFEMIAEDGDLVIARVRLPRHPDTATSVTEEDEQYAIECEIASMEFVRKNCPAARVPKVYTYARPGSEFATQAGASYMLLEGFYGNTLQDIEFDMCQLPIETQEHIITQWTAIQAALSTMVFPQIGSISSVSDSGEAIIGRLATAAAEGLRCQGPFSDAKDYFKAIAEAGLQPSKPSEDQDGPSFGRTGASVLLDIIENTDLFPSNRGPFPLNHMDLGTQNILVDESFNILSIIDWEFAQTAPWEANHFPWPFPLLCSDEKIEAALNDPSSLAHKNFSKQAAARKMYVQKYQEIENELRRQGRGLQRSISEVLSCTSSRVYGCYARIASAGDGGEGLVREMVRLAYGFDEEGTTNYLQRFDGSSSADVAQSTDSNL